jgi:hypothetical protein
MQIEVEKLEFVKSGCYPNAKGGQKVSFNLITIQSPSKKMNSWRQLFFLAYQKRVETQKSASSTDF